MNSDKLNYGTLNIVATPIGNLNDITLRALEVLKSVDIIAAEDTRRTIKLLNHFDIKKRLISYHEHSDSQKEQKLIDMLKEGVNIALVSDAGTPLISDPGYGLVKKCIEENIRIESLPGASAATTAATLSGMNLTQYIFCGFLAAKSAARKKELTRFHQYHLPLIIYESPNRILKTLDDIIEIWGEDIEVCVARELTKLHEEVIRGSALNAKEQLSLKPDIKGEFVIIVSAAKMTNQMSDEEFIAALTAELKSGKSKKEAARVVSERTGKSKNELYKLALQLNIKE